MYLVLLTQRRKTRFLSRFPTLYSLLVSIISSVHSNSNPLPTPGAPGAHSYLNSATPNTPLLVLLTLLENLGYKKREQIAYFINTISPFPHLGVSFTDSTVTTLAQYNTTIDSNTGTYC